jgi:hypothetical protein
VSWNIDHYGDITPLDNGPKVPWWLALDEDYEDFNPDDTPRCECPAHDE